jgi:hypothetical protein
MWDFSISRSLGLMARTMPFIALRLAVYFGMAAAYVVVTGTGAGIGWGIGAFGDDGFRSGAIFWGGVTGFGLTASVLYFLREYVLYVVKAGHIAVLVELLDGGELPSGKSQVAHATAVVRQRFGEASVLFAIDQLVKGVLRVVTGFVQGIAALLPIPGLRQLTGILRVLFNISVGTIDEVILAYAIRTGSTNPWQSARTALVLYGQNYKLMLKNAAWLTIIVYGLSFLIFLLMLAPAAALVWLIPGAWSAGGLVFALIFAWAVKAALIEPFAMACMMGVYFSAIEGQQPRPEWDAKLASVSKQFNKIKDKAIGGRNAPGAGFGVSARQEGSTS